MVFVCYSDIDQARFELNTQDTVEDEGVELALNTLEEFGGDVEAAVQEIADQSGIRIDSDWLDQQCRQVVCENKYVRNSLPALAEVAVSCLTIPHLSPIAAGALAVLVAMTVEAGIDAYCKYK